MKTEIVNVMGSDIQVVYNEAGEMFVSVRHVCDAIGIDPSSQRKKIQDSDTYKGVAVIITSTANDGKQYESLCLNINMVSLWLAGIHPGKVSEHIRPKLITYQRECAKILYNHFAGNHYLSPLAEPPTKLELTPEAMEFVTHMQRFFPSRSEFEVLRSEVEELRGMLNVLWSEDDIIEVQAVIKETKEKLGWDGRKLLGHIRSELNTQRVYASDMKDKVVNLCKRMLVGVFA